MYIYTRIYIYITIATVAFKLIVKHFVVLIQVVRVNYTERMQGTRAANK